MVEISENVKELTKELKQTDQFKELKKSIKTLKDNPESLKLYQEMDELQKKIMQAQNSGEPLSDDLRKQYQDINGKVSSNEELKDMITKEQDVFKLVNDLQQELTKPIGNLYKKLQAK